jgi:hypothetical protein
LQDLKTILFNIWYFQVRRLYGNVCYAFTVSSLIQKPLKSFCLGGLTISSHLVLLLKGFFALFFVKSKYYWF